MANNQLLSQIRTVVREELTENQKKNDKKFESVDKRFESIDKKFESVDQKFESIDKRFDSVDKTLKYIKKKVKKLDEFDRFFDKEHQETRKRLDKIEGYIKLPQN